MHYRVPDSGALSLELHKLLLGVLKHARSSNEQLEIDACSWVMEGGISSVMQLWLHLDGAMGGSMSLLHNVLTSLLQKVRIVTER